MFLRLFRVFSFVCFPRRVSVLDCCPCKQAAGPAELPHKGRLAKSEPILLFFVCRRKLLAHIRRTKNTLAVRALTLKQKSFYLIFSAFSFLHILYLSQFPSTFPSLSLSFSLLHPFSFFLSLSSLLFLSFSFSHLFFLYLSFSSCAFVFTLFFSLRSARRNFLSLTPSFSFYILRKKKISWHRPFSSLYSVAFSFSLAMFSIVTTKTVRVDCTF